MWPTGEDLDLDYKFRVGRMARDVSSKFQLKVVRTASSIILDSAELGLCWLRQLKMPTRRENGIYSAELGLLVGSELAASWLRNEFQLYSALSWHLVGITAVT